MSLLELPPVRRYGPPRTTFVLGGGGNLGAVQVGMVRALLERGIRPDEIVGCSAGALNAAALAADPTLSGATRLERIWSSLGRTGVGPSTLFSHLRLFRSRSQGLSSNAGLRRLIAEYVPFSTFEEAIVPFHVVAANLDTGRERWFSSGPLMEPVLASAALPAVFPPVVIGGERYIDGAVVNNVPISKAVQLGAERIFVLHVGNFDRPRPTPRRPIDVLLQSFSISRNCRFLADSERPPPGVEMVILPGVDPGALRYNDFAQSSVLIERGYETTMGFLEGMPIRAGG